MSEHTDDTNTNLHLPEEEQACETAPADDTSAIQEALAQEIQNVTTDIPKLDLSGISGEEPEAALPEEDSGRQFSAGSGICKHLVSDFYVHEHSHCRLVLSVPPCI